MLVKDYFSMLGAKLRFKTAEFTQAVELQKRHFEAALHGPRAEKWYRRNKGPVADNMTGLSKLRGFSRDLVRNNPYAQRAVNIIAKNTVGTGIVPIFKGSKDKAIAKKWQAWAGKKVCDFNDLMSFYGIQEQVMRAVAESGDALLLRRWDPDNPMGFEIQVLESDYLDETVTRAEQNGGFVLQGVAFNARGKRIGYYLHEQHPGEVRYNYSAKTGTQSRFIPVSEVIHVFEVLRPGQVRGIPMGVSAFIKLKDFDEFQDAQLYKQKVAACFVMVVTDSGPMFNGKKVNPTDYDPVERLTPGMVEYLPTGKDVKFSQPPTTEGTGEFATNVLRSIAVGYNVTYEALTNDYSKVNFSSGRMGWLEFARNVQSWQDNIMITMLCDGVYDWFRDGLRIMGGYSENLNVTWTTPRREMIDPKKEGDALEALVKAGFMSHQERIRLQGYDPDDVYAEIAQDMAKAKELNAMFSVDVRKPEIAPAPGTKALAAPKPKAVSTK